MDIGVAASVSDAVERMVDARPLARPPSKGQRTEAPERAPPPLRNFRRWSCTRTPLRSCCPTALREGSLATDGRTPGRSLF